MPRQDKNRIEDRAAVQVTSKPETTAVVSRPTSPAVTAADSSLDSLITGLSQFNRSLIQNDEANADADLIAGQKARQNGDTPETPQSRREWFQYGYMSMDGRVKAAKDAEEIRTKFITEFDKDGGNVEEFLAKEYAQRTEGLTDKAFLDGYRTVLGQGLDGIRKAHGEYQRGRVVETVESNAMALLEQTVQGYVSKGQPVPQEALEAVKQDMRKAFGTSYSRFNELLFNSLHRIGQETGNHAVYEVLKKPNPDGTPGMYFIPAWKEKIDVAQVQAMNIAVTRANQATEVARKQREERQETALAGVFMKLYDGRTDEARAEMDTLVRNGLFTRASDLVKFEEMFRKVDKREATAAQQTTMNEVLVGIYKGTVTPSMINAADITVDQKRSLLSEWYRKKNDDRSAALQARALEDGPFRSHAFVEQERFVDGQFAGINDIMGNFTNENEFLKSVRATARLELAEYVRNNGGKLDGIREAALEITKRHQQRYDAFRAGRITMEEKGLRYMDPASAAAAGRAGKLSTADLAAHLEVFENRAKTKPNTPGAKPNVK